VTPIIHHFSLQNYYYYWATVRDFCQGVYIRRLAILYIFVVRRGRSPCLFIKMGLASVAVAMIIIIYASILPPSSNNWAAIVG
jgi:hypothetical protein